MKRWLLVYGPLGMGGIETLIVRLANHLASEGKDVAVLHSGGENVPLLSPDVTPLEYASRQSAIGLGSRWLGREQAPAALISFDPISAALGLAIEAAAPGGRAVHLSGIYHPRAFFMDGERADRRWLNRMVAEAVGFERLFFMNEESRAEKQRRWEVALHRSPIIPVPVEERNRQWSRAASEVPLRIVSVGRLTDFKQYNIGASFIVRRLLDDGVEVSWDIYGDGALEPEVRAAIERQGVSKQLRLCGTLPYAQLASTLLDYDLFVGLGTAALEASMLGIPTIAATDSSAEGSYGWFHQLPFGNLGERQEGKEPTHRIEQLIRDYRAMPQADRMTLSQDLHSGALRYALPGVARQLEALADAAPSGGAPRAKRLTSMLYGLLTDSLPIRMVRALR